MNFHQPVLLEESVQKLITQTDGVYVDVTFGGGGHSKKILEKLGSNARLFAFDKDADAVVNAKMWTDERLTLIQSDYRFLGAYMEYYSIEVIDGLLADFGVSSYQLNVRDRGFAYRLGGNLDMRMDKRSRLTAGYILNNYSKEELVVMFSRYGELRNAIQLVTVIVKERQRKSFDDIEDFVKRIRPAVRGKAPKYLAQVFQALRIEVNGELKAIEEMLDSTKRLLRPGGRLVAISYHSLEDRMMKNMIKTGNVEGKPERDERGRIKRFFKPLFKGVYTASEVEINSNPRARSAKMRVGIRTDEPL